MSAHNFSALVMAATLLSCAGRALPGPPAVHSRHIRALVAQLEAPDSPTRADLDDGRWIIVETRDSSFLWRRLSADDSGEPIGVYFDRVAQTAGAWFGSANLHHALGTLPDAPSIELADLIHGDAALWAAWSDDPSDNFSGWWEPLLVPHSGIWRAVPPPPDDDPGDDPGDEPCEEPQAARFADGGPSLDAEQQADLDDLIERAGCCTGSCCGGCNCCGGRCCNYGCCAGRCCAGACCGGTCCASGVCCAGAPGGCCQDSEEKCCGDHCCADYEVCAAPPKNCCPPSTTDCGGQTCCESGETCVEGDLRSGAICCPVGVEQCNKTCCQPGEICGPCNNQCGAKGRCCFFDSGACQETTLACCQQQGGTWDGGGTSCDPPDYCKPECDDCIEETVHFSECYHLPSDAVGVPCSTTDCLENVFSVGGCSWYPHRAGPPMCDTRFDANSVVWLQFRRQSTSPCPPQFVMPENVYLSHRGCTACPQRTVIDGTCFIPECQGVIVPPNYQQTGGPRCGCP